MVGLALLTIQGARSMVLDPNEKVDFTSSLRLEGESVGWTLIGAGLVSLAGGARSVSSRRDESRARPRRRIAAGVALAVIVSALGVSLLRFGAELDAQLPLRDAPDRALALPPYDRGLPLQE